jgi:hypothetical protein
MGVSKERTTIGDTTYEIQTFGTKKGQAVLLRLFKTLGPAAAEITSRGFDGIGQALVLASTNTSDADLTFVLDSLAEQTTVYLPTTTTAGSGAVGIKLSDLYDNHFAGRWDEWALWIGWGVRVNFQSFFSGKAFGAILEKFAQAASESESPKG